MARADPDARPPWACTTPISRPRRSSALRRRPVFPAHPLALDARRAFDPVRQRALTRYYIDAGAGASRSACTPPSSRSATRAVRAGAAHGHRDRGDDGRNAAVPMIAGLVGRTAAGAARGRCRARPRLPRGLLSLAASRRAAEDELIAHCQAIAARDPAGRLLPPAGGRRHRAPRPRSGAASPRSTTWWRSRSRRSTATARSTWCAAWSRPGPSRIALYTGNDDHIVADLLTPFRFRRATSRSPCASAAACSATGRSGPKAWSSCSSAASAAAGRGRDRPPTLLALDAAVTDCNGAFFDVANDFEGCIAGVHEVLRRQGLLEGTWCLDPDEDLGPARRRRSTASCRLSRPQRRRLRRRQRRRHPGTRLPAGR